MSGVDRLTTSIDPDTDTDQVVDAFVEVKTFEWRLYNRVISSWEREYLLINV